MKALTGDSNESSDSDSDGFDIEAWRKSKAQTQQIVREDIKKKRTNSDLDSKKTVKYKQDPVMNSIYEKILRESDKFEDLDLDPVDERKDLYEYNPHIICGQLTNIRTCSEKQKEQFTLSDENFCQAMDLTENITVVIVGKIGYTPIQGINANLYVPKEFYEYMAQKSLKTQPPQRLVRLSGNRFAIWIKREIKKDSSMNIMSYPYLVLDPYNLLYPSYICSWIDCKRRISLANYIQGEKEVNQAVVFGSTCHRLLEWLAENVITVNDYYTKKVSVLEKLYNSMLYDMFLVDRTYDQFMEVCSNRLENLVKFYDRHILRGEEIEAEKYKKTYLKIQKVISSQYMFRSNFFGLKGKVDLLLAGQYINKQNGKSQSVFIPMELKTGKKLSDTHKKQTEIYNILVREKYKANVVGLLYYSDSDMKIVINENPLSAFEIITLHRNQIAQNLVKLYQNKTINLPSFPSNFAQCNFCQQSNICELSYNDIQDSNTVKNIVDVPSKYHKNIAQTSKKYTRKEIEYISKWFKMIHLEEMEFKKLNTNYWKMGISNFILSFTQMGNVKVGESKVRLQMTHHCKNQEQLFVFEEFYKTSTKIRMIANQINMIEGCKIISTSTDTQKKYFRMIVQMNNLQIQYSPNKLNYFAENEHDVDVDVETFQNSFFGVMRNSVLNLVQNQTYLKDLLINDTEGKNMIEIDSDDDYTIPRQFAIQEQQLEGFNQDQKKAYKKSVLEQKFCLVEGMPGTGKTELIIRLIEKFSKMKKTILVTTFTNRALDNILQRLVDSGRVEKDKIIRQGAQYACSKTLRQYTSHGMTFANLSDYKKFYSKKSIWFVTLSSLYVHHLPKSFDIAILDEASQCLEPTCIEGLLKAQKFILIGDYKQLQPLIKSKAAYRKGMCLSLFQRLCKLYPSNCISLKKQYRMNLKIMTLSNQLVYNGELELATDKIKSKTIKLPLEWETKVPASFYNVFSPQNPIVFINYDPIIDSITKKYKQKEPIIRKIIEAELSAYVFSKFFHLEILLKSMSVIAAMNSSVNKIVDLLKQSKIISDNHGNILTIDKSQGIDKDIIILLIQRGNEQLVQNPRRLNVALTRAKSKLIIIGSDQHLSKMKVWDGTLGRMLKEYQVELTKAMIEDMIKIFDWS